MQQYQVQAGVTHMVNGTTYQFNVKETDLAGNTSDATSNFTVTGDTTRPSVTPNAGNLNASDSAGSEYRDRHGLPDQRECQR